MRTLLVLTLVLIIVGCAPLADTAQTPMPSLDGTDWVLTAISGTMPIADSKITLKFEQGSASGSAGCNQYRSAYTTNGSKLEFGLTSSTKRACLAQAMNAQETAYLGALAKVAAHEASADRLVLRDAANATVLEFAKAPPSI